MPRIFAIFCKNSSDSFQFVFSFREFTEFLCNMKGWNCFWPFQRCTSWRLSSIFCLLTQESNEICHGVHWYLWGHSSIIKALVINLLLDHLWTLMIYLVITCFIPCNFSPYICNTTSMEQTLSCNSYWACQIFCILWNLKFYCSFHKSLPLAQILSQWTLSVSRP